MSAADAKTLEDLRREVEELRARLEEAEETIGAIRAYRVGAFVVSAPRERVFALETAERPWHTLVEHMGQGAAVLRDDGAVLYANPALEVLVRRDRDRLRGVRLEELVAEGSRPALEALLATARGGFAQGEVALLRPDGSQVPAHVALNRLPEEVGGLGALVTDLTVQLHYHDLKRAEAALRRSEAHYRQIVETAHEGIWKIDLQGRTLFVNRRLADLLGYPPEEMLGRPVTDFCFAEDLPRAHARIRANLAGHNEQFDFRFRRRDGSELLVLASTSPVTDPAGRVTAALGMFSDVTERRRAEETLRVSRQRMELVAQSIGLGVWYWDLPLNRMVWNAQRKAHFGLPPDAEVTIDTFYERLHPDDRERVRQAVERALAECGDYDVEHRTVAPDGRERWLRSIGRAFADESGRAVRFDGVSVDITERRQAEAALREADRRKDEFLAVLAHELRNPLGPIRNATQFLGVVGSREPEAVRAREMIDRQVRHMARIIDDLLDVSRIARGKVLLRPERCDLAALVQRAVEDQRVGGQPSGPQVELHLPPGPVWVRGDPVRLAQAVGNVLHNACKFTDPDGRVTVRVEADESAGEAVVAVRDTGVGMDPETLARVFDAFSQADRSRERSRGGLGLGLALVKGLMELHGGRVVASSDGPGRGSEVLLAVPLGREAPAESPPPTPARPEAPAPRRVLIIEDSPDNAESLRLLLEMAGHSVAVALNGPAGLEAARGHRPDVVLCDIGLPGGTDGYAVARALRGDPATATAYLVALTGYGAEEDQRRAVEAGFDLHLTKPVDFANLQAVLAELPR
ncbi:MAG TPA: PAS domain S-box protein, partial [Gemmataceae bacterium]|nr:PAS domain S-box protein [Gemmataceae bacterium]